MKISPSCVRVTDVFVVFALLPLTATSVRNYT